MLSNTDAHHRFIAEECDWGLTRFSELRKLFSIQDGHARPTTEDEQAVVSVFVRVLEDPTGVLLRDLSNVRPLSPQAGRQSRLSVDAFPVWFTSPEISSPDWDPFLLGRHICEYYARQMSIVRL